jgi:hypothetical protein
MTVFLSDSSTWTSAIETFDDGDPAATPEIRTPIQGLADRTRFLRDLATTHEERFAADEATQLAYRTRDDANALAAAIQGMPWFQTELTMANSTGPLMAAGDCWPSPTGYYAGWSPIHTSIEWDGSGALRMREVNQNGIGSPLALSTISSGVTAVEHAMIAPMTFGASRQSITQVGYITGTYSGARITWALVQGSDALQSIGGGSNQVPIGCGYDPAFGQLVLLSDRVSGYAYVYSATSAASGWTLRVNAQRDAAVPLTYQQFPWVNNCHSLGFSPTTNQPQYWWGRGVANSHKLVRFQWTPSTQQLTTTLSESAGGTITFADVCSFTSGASFGAAGDGARVMVSFNMLGAMNWTLNFTPVEPYAQILCLVIGGRHLVGLRGAWTHSWSFYDVTSGTTAVPFLQHVMPGGALFKSLAGWTANCTLFGARWTNAANAHGLGIASDSRLNWATPHSY